MRLAVVIQFCGCFEITLAIHALEHIPVTVEGGEMVDQFVFVFEHLLTIYTLVWILIVRFHVLVQITLAGAVFLANQTYEQILFRVYLYVFVDLFFGAEHHLTERAF